MQVLHIEQISTCYEKNFRQTDFSLLPKVILFEKKEKFSCLSFIWVMSEGEYKQNTYSNIVPARKIITLYRYSSQMDDVTKKIFVQKVCMILDHYFEELHVFRSP